MRFLIPAVALLVVSCYAAKCPAPTDVDAKQAKVDKILSYFNKPLNPAPQKIDVDKTKLKGIGILPRHDIFSIFDERVWPEATKVLEKLMAAPTFDDFLKITEALYSRVNEDLLLYAFSVALVHRPDTQGVHIPRVHDIYPDKFLTNDVVHKLKDNIVHGKKNPTVNDTHDHINNFDLFHRVAYFTEDLGMNSHHYHWHVLHPGIWTEKLGHKERIGELFYYMHRQMVARFDAELMSNHMARIAPFEDWAAPIKMGYAPHLTIQRTGYNYMFRPAGLVLRDLPELTKHQMRQWKHRITTAIHLGSALHENGTKLTLKDERGIDTLANLVISTMNSVNHQFYGNLHSYAHTIAARIADPDGKFREDSGVMADVTTAARDPLFYSWHKFIDNIFSDYQDSLPAYTKYDLRWQDVIIKDVGIDCHEYKNEDNIIHTFYTRNTLKLSKGFDFTRDSEAIVNVKHIDHEDFTYVFHVENTGKTEKHAVFRVFLAPVLDERGHPLDVHEQRLLMIELDKFVATLRPGQNEIRHNSNESSVTMPVREIYGNVAELHDDDHCHCGWPEYMLVPKGTYEGMKFKLFVIATNWDEDQATTDKSCHCKDSLSYCGSILEEYPDRRPMGYPFNRHLDVEDWSQIRTQNMALADVVIKFTGEERVYEHNHQH